MHFQSVGLHQASMVTTLRYYTSPFHDRDSERPDIDGRVPVFVRCRERIRNSAHHPHPCARLHGPYPPSVPRLQNTSRLVWDNSGKSSHPFRPDRRSTRGFLRWHHRGCSASPKSGVARDPAVPVVLMHSRGDAGVSKDCGTHSGGLVSAIQAEVGHEVVVDP